MIKKCTKEVPCCEVHEPADDRRRPVWHRLPEPRAGGLGPDAGGDQAHPQAGQHPGDASENDEEPWEINEKPWKSMKIHGKTGELGGFRGEHDLIKLSRRRFRRLGPKIRQDRCVLFDVYTEISCLDAIRFEDIIQNHRFPEPWRRISVISTTSEWRSRATGSSWSATISCQTCFKPISSRCYLIL